MKVELRKVKCHPGMSRETIAFESELWIDGANVGWCSNDGGGGCNRVEWKMGQRILEDELRKFALSQPRHESAPEIKMDLDWFITCLMVETDEKNKEERRWKRLCKTKCVMLVKENGKVLEYTRAVPYSPVVAGQIRAKFGANLVEIINERYV